MGTLRKPPVRLAIVGLGRWGKRLVESVQGRCPEIIFTHGVTRTLATAADFATRHRIAMLADFRALLKEPDIDGVVLATPHSQHVGQIRAAAAAGKHVFCEKPIALTLEEAEVAFDAADAAGVHLCVGHSRRFLPAFETMKRRLPEIGPVLQMIGNFSWSALPHSPGGWRSFPSESPAGGMTGLGIHMADAMIGLGLEPRAAMVAIRRSACSSLEDTVTALIDAGPTIGILTTKIGPGRFWRLEVFGTMGSMIWDGEERVIIKRSDGPAEAVGFEPTDIEAAEIEAFGTTICGQAGWPVTRRQALDGISLLEAICQAHDAQTSGTREGSFRRSSRSAGRISKQVS